MAGLYEQLAKSRKLNPDRIKKDLSKFVRSIEKQIVDKNKEQLEVDSQDIHGKAIGFYSYATDLISGGKKKRGDPFTGVDTGDWFKGFYMQEVSGVIRLGSTDPKTNDILSSEHWLSDDLFGLTDENLSEIIEKQILPFIIENSRKILEI